jgi:hypothetical protein
MTVELNLKDETINQYSQREIELAYREILESIVEQFGENSLHVQLIENNISVNK